MLTKSSYKFIILGLILAFLFSSAATTHVVKLKRKEEREQRMSWWREAKFGMFIHWGLYAIPAGVWKGQEYEGIGEWIMSHADIPVHEYEKLAYKFNPVKFNAEEWVKLAKEAGVKYIVITSKHHDGFSLFDSKVTEYDIVDATPYKKDILKALNKECKKVGIKFCTYYSILDWHHPAQEPKREEKKNIYGNNLIKEGRKREYIDYMKAQLKELITQYDPGVLWFDGGWVDWWTPKDGKEIMDYLWSLKSNLIINNRAAGNDKMEMVMGDYLTPEQYIPAEHQNKDWESCMTMNDTWGYKKNDNNWKSTKVLITNLIDIVSKGGNFLLNVGPTAEGVIPEPSVKRLKEIGEWMKINGEAIYGTKRWHVIREGPTKVLFIDSYEEDLGTIHEPEYTPQDILFTTKNNTIYAICLAWPEGNVEIKSLGKQSMPDIQVLDVTMIGSDEKLKWTSGEESLSIIPPKEKPCKYAYVFKIKIKES